VLIKNQTGSCNCEVHRKGIHLGATTLQLITRGEEERGKSSAQGSCGTGCSRRDRLGGRMKKGIPKESQKEARRVAKAGFQRTTKGKKSWKKLQATGAKGSKQ